MKTVSPLLRVPLMKAMYGSVLLTQMKQLLHKLFWKTRKKEKMMVVAWHRPTKAVIHKKL